MTRLLLAYFTLVWLVVPYPVTFGALLLGGAAFVLGRRLVARFAT